MENKKKERAGKRKGWKENRRTKNTEGKGGKRGGYKNYRRKIQEKPRRKPK